MTPGLRTILLPFICLLMIIRAYMPADHEPMSGCTIAVVSEIPAEYILSIGTEENDDHKKPLGQGDMPPLEQDSEEDNEESEGKEIPGLGENFYLKFRHICNSYTVNNEVPVATEHLSNPTPPPELG